MSLSDKEKNEFRDDGLSPARRDEFRHARHPSPPTFLEYLRSLEDLFALKPQKSNRTAIPYSNVKI